MRTMATVTACVTVSMICGQAPPTPRVLPGVRADGFIQLPNQWSLKPAGKQIEVGNFPVQIAFHPSGKWVAAIHSGNADHEIVVLDAAAQKIVSRTLLDHSFYGLAFAPDGKRIFASGGEKADVHQFDFDEGLLHAHKRLALGGDTKKTIIGGVAVDAAGKTLYAAGTWGDSLYFVELDRPADVASMSLGADSYPYAVLSWGDKLLVSLWAQSAVAVVDPKEKKIVARWATEDHPTEMALTPNGKAMFVSCANSTKVSVIDTGTGKAKETLACSLYPQVPKGNTPSSLCLSADGKLLFVANSDANNVALFNVSEIGDAKPLGFIPVGWYPTSVRFDQTRKVIWVANGKGVISKANPLGPQPGVARPANLDEYIGRLFKGTVSTIPLPSPQAMVNHTKIAQQCSPLKSDASAAVARPPGNPIPAKVGDESPIKYCVYIVKENRTYDQVLGDMKEGNGDPKLCLFPEKVTPNHHKIAREFVLLDNFYVDGEVSADGHEWTMGAYATDYVEKAWPISYRSGNLKKIGYPSEGEGPPVASTGVYFWDRCKDAGVSYFSFGEFVENAPKIGDPGTSRVKALEGRFDPHFRSFDMNYQDQKRADRFLSELARFEKEGEMPRFVVMRLTNDHTAGTGRGAWTPTAMVADNDLALGRVLEGLSKSKFWPQMAVFVIEDDAQNGPDHVDAHRVVALVASPYCRRGVVDSSFYSTSSMLRTMGLILGTKPMSQFDAAARPMYASFQEKPDLRPYVHEAARVDINARNGDRAFGQEKTASFRLDKEDQADDLAFNEVIWKSVKGVDSPMPAPVRAAFFLPRKGEKDDDD
jgi:DNA-binding beta-propeller fold protein YncE